MGSIISASVPAFAGVSAKADAGGAASGRRPAEAVDAALPQTKGQARARWPARHPRTQVMLGRLRTELGRIVLPSTAAEAHEEIVQALMRAQLGGWSLPGLGDGVVRQHPGGSLSIPLVAHVIVINPWGAFRILDCLRPAAPYFETAGAAGRPFALPWLEDEPGLSLTAPRGCGAK